MSKFKDAYDWAFLPSNLPEMGTVKPLNKLSDELFQRHSRVTNEEARQKRPESNARPIFVKVGVVEIPSAGSLLGSAYLEVGGCTKVMAVVRGPIPLSNMSNKLSVSSKIQALPMNLMSSVDATISESPVASIEIDSPGRLYVHVRYAPFANPYLTTSLTSISDSLANLVNQALAPAISLENYPKSAIEIDLTVIEDDGSLLAALISVSSAAVAHAGIHMKDLVIASSCLLLEKEGNLESSSSRIILVDPCLADEMSSSLLTSHQKWMERSTIILAYMPSLHEISHLYMIGRSTPDGLMETIEWCQEACQAFYSIIKAALLTSIDKLSNI
jgi:ribonuclease PH